LIDLGFLKSAWRYDRKAVVAALREFLDATFPAEGPAEIDARLEFGRKHSPGSVNAKLSFQYESLRWSATTSIEKIAFARKRLSIVATDRQRSAEIVATVTIG
jgi:hypothetical protein